MERQGGVAVGSTVHPAHVDADAFVPALQQNAQQSAAVIEPDLWAAHLFVTFLERALVEDNGTETVDDLRAGRRVCAGAGYADWAEAGGHCAGCVTACRWTRFDEFKHCKITSYLPRRAK
jgi:hypothetical protein